MSRQTVSGVLFLAENLLGSLKQARLEAEVLLANVLQVDRSYLRTHPERRVSFMKRCIFFYSVRLRAKHIPIAYINGWKEWAGFRISVTPSVLIPRDETEILIQKIREIEKNNPKNILDVGTGSGCISIAVSKIFPDAVVTAIDYSRAALSVAQKNFRDHKIDVDVRYSDLLSAISPKSKFDLIVANLPYLPKDISLEEEVKREPEEALFAGKEGLDLLCRFAKELREKEIEFHSLWIEFLPQQWGDIQLLFKHWNIQSHQDIGGDIYFARITPR
jgi:release factor glutamine methyltransferase